MGKQLTKTTAWKWFSLYIRLRDSFEGGYVKCATCKTYKHFREMQAGHYFTQGSHKRIVFDERNCHPQCISCNHYKSGNIPVYTTVMIEKYGADVFDKLNLANRINPRGYDYTAIANKYRKLVTDFCREKNVIL